MLNRKVYKNIDPGALWGVCTAVLTLSGAYVWCDVLEQLRGAHTPPWALPPMYRSATWVLAGPLASTPPLAALTYTSQWACIRATSRGATR